MLSKKLIRAVDKRLAAEPRGQKRYVNFAMNASPAEWASAKRTGSMSIARQVRIAEAIALPESDIAAIVMEAMTGDRRIGKAAVGYLMRNSAQDAPQAHETQTPTPDNP